MKKRFLTASLATMMVLSLAACGGGKAADTTTAPAATEAPADTKAEDKAEETKAEETKAEAEAEAEKLLKRVGLWEKKDQFPRQLSGGQKQRVAIVRALCMHPEVMLFDEVTAALDPEMVREVLGVMLELAEQGLTMVIVTHEMQFARAIADRIMFLDGGKVVEETDPETFFTNPSSERTRQFLSTFSFDKHTVHLQENDAE